MSPSVRSRLSTLVIVIVGVVVAQTAIAAIPSADQTISGCYSKKSGTLRVIDAERGDTCKAGEELLSWNQQGVPGEPGLKGDPGEPGLPGTSVAARLRWAGDVTVPTQSPTDPIALGSWTQPGDEIDGLVPGIVTVVVPAGCFGDLTVEVQGWDSGLAYDPSRFAPPRFGVGAYGLDARGSSEAVTFTRRLSGWASFENLMFEPATDTSRSLSATVSGWANCPGQGSLVSLRIQSLSFDVAAFR